MYKRFQEKTALDTKRYIWHSRFNCSGAIALATWISSHATSIYSGKTSAADT
jgi:hypothetical protein